MLLPGITLNVLSDLFEPSDVVISSGTRPLPGAADIPSAAAAIIARDDWRPLSAAEAGALLATTPTPLHDMMTLIDLDPAALRDCHRDLLPLLADADPTEVDPADATRRTVAVREVRDRLLDTLDRRAGITCRATGPADVVVHPPGQPSTAFNYAERVFMGLHLDNHQNYALTERHLSYLLAGVNLGFCERYVHFVNLRVFALVKLLRDAGRPVPTTTHELKNAFFAAYGSYPVLRIMLRPGQAYLVNTQDVLHDGATNTRGLPDVSLLTANDLTANDLSVREPSAAR